MAKCLQCLCFTLARCMSGLKQSCVVCAICRGLAHTWKACPRRTSSQLTLGAHLQGAVISSDACLPLQVKDFVPQALTITSANRPKQVLKGRIVYHGYLRRHKSVSAVPGKDKQQSLSAVAKLRRFMLGIVESVSSGIADVRVSSKLQVLESCWPGCNRFVLLMRTDKQVQSACTCFRS